MTQARWTSQIRLVAQFVGWSRSLQEQHGQVILLLPRFPFRSDQRHPLLPVEGELVELSAHPELGLADAFLAALPNCHVAFSSEGGKRLEK